MDIEYFKDKLFDLLNDADNIGIINIETYDKENIFKIFFQNGNIYEIECRQILY
ncbi:MAG: hypothetical protein HFJ03_03575 [Lachnospira sp.]|jgi:hypothetical protein|nr:hypothetical protein [Lachnospira sp.]